MFCKKNTKRMKLNYFYILGTYKKHDQSDTGKNETVCGKKGHPYYEALF